MKILVLSCFLVTSFAAYAQIDSIKYVEFIDKVGNRKKALVVKVEQVLIVDGDSIYTVFDDFKLRKIIEGREGLKIINDRDSISLFFRTRIKSIFILKENKP